MSLWYTNFTRKSGTVAVQRQLRPRFLILLARHADIGNSPLYTVHSTARPADRLTAIQHNVLVYGTIRPVRNCRRTDDLALPVGVELIPGQNTKTLTANSWSV